MKFSCSDVQNYSSFHLLVKVGTLMKIVHMDQCNMTLEWLNSYKKLISKWIAGPARSYKIVTNLYAIILIHKFSLLGSQVECSKCILKSVHLPYQQINKYQNVILTRKQKSFLFIS